MSFFQLPSCCFLWSKCFERSPCFIHYLHNDSLIRHFYTTYLPFLKLILFSFTTFELFHFVTVHFSLSMKLIYKTNKNTVTGQANCKKTTRHHAHLSLCTKSRKTKDAKSRKWPKASIWAFFWRFRGQISPNC